MAVNLPNNPANGDSVLLNGTTYVYNSTNNSWDIPLVTEATLPLTTLSVAPEATPSGDGAISYDNTTGIFTYTPPVISGGSGTIAYANTTDLPTSGVTTGAMAYVSGNNKLYMWNGTVWFNIAIVNQAPTAITGNQATYVLATDGTPTVVTLVSTDPEGFPLTFSSSTSGDTQVGTVTNTDNVFTITPSTNEADIGTLSVTFSVTDGNNTETSVSSFTLEFLSPYWNETVLSIGTSSTNGLANSTFIDRSTNAHTVTPAGTPVQTAFHPYLDNWSVDFDGTNDYISVSHNVDINLSSGDFTIECWFYKNNTSTGSGSELFNKDGVYSASYTSYGVNITNAGALTFRAGYGAGTSSTGIVYSISETIQLNRWYHYAVVKSGTTIIQYLNGVQVGSATQGLAITDGGKALLIGYQASQPNNRTFPGYISNFRIVKGTAVYTTNFTPSTEKLTAISGTSLLTCQSNRFIDNSASELTITSVNGAKISAFNPFGQETEYAVGENKGSGYFGGAGDNLSITGDSGLSLDVDFTVSFWISMNELGAAGVISNSASSFVGEGAKFLTSHSTAVNKISFWAYNIRTTGYLVTSTTTLTAGQWFHVAVTRQSGTLRLFVNGALEGSRSSSAGTVNLIANGAMKVGTYWGGDFDGYISDIRIVKGTAVYTANFTPPTAPVGNTNSSLYLPMDNAGVFDKTGNNTLTPVGNASTSTTYTKYADTAMYFDGNGGRLTIADDASLNLGSGDFTIECWAFTNVTISSYSASYAHIFGKGNGVDNQTYAVGFYQGGIVFSTSTLVQGSISVVENSWYHIAVTRESGTVRLFVNGALDVSTSLSTDFTNTNSFNIGDRQTGDASGQYPSNGYIENLQILKGVAKYTANFTPPNRTQGRAYQAES